jgi:hypothetical protein
MWAPAGGLEGSAPSAESPQPWAGAKLLPQPARAGEGRLRPQHMHTASICGLWTGAQRDGSGGTSVSCKSTCMGAPTAQRARPKELQAGSGRTIRADASPIAEAALASGSLAKSGFCSCRLPRSWACGLNSGLCSSCTTMACDGRCSAAQHNTGQQIVSRSANCDMMQAYDAGGHNSCSFLVHFAASCN